MNGQPVRRVEYRGNTQPRNYIIINSAWKRCENGIYNLEDFIRNVSHTTEQLLRNEIGEPNFIERRKLTIKEKITIIIKNKYYYS